MFELSIDSKVLHDGSLPTVSLDFEDGRLGIKELDLGASSQQFALNLQFSNDLCVKSIAIKMYRSRGINVKGNSTSQLDDSLESATF